MHSLSFIEVQEYFLCRRIFITGDNYSYITTRSKLGLLSYIGSLPKPEERLHLWAVVGGRYLVLFTKFGCLKKLQLHLSLLLDLIDSSLFFTTLSSERFELCIVGHIDIASYTMTA